MVELRGVSDNTTKLILDLLQSKSVSDTNRKLQ